MAEHLEPKYGVRARTESGTEIDVQGFRVPDSAVTAGSGIVNLSTGGIDTGIHRVVVLTGNGDLTAGSALETDYVYFFTGLCNLSLPTPVGNTNRYSFLNIHFDTNSVFPPDGFTINGETVYSLIPDQKVEIQSNGSQWYTMSSPKITVGETSPPNPALNDVWIDTSGL